MIAERRPVRYHLLVRGTAQRKRLSPRYEDRPGDASRTVVDDALFDIKIALPRRHVDAIPRHGLVGVIQRSRAKLIVVRAPAGFGKTTVLQQWSDELNSDGIACAWLTLDAGDNDPARLLAGLSAATQETRRRGGEGGVAGGGAALASRLVASLRCSSRPLVVILDDIDVLQTSGARNIVRMLLQTTPEGVRIVVAGRSIPSFGQARLRLTDAVMDVGVEDLRFSIDETSTFLSRRLPDALTGAQLNQLHIYTEGWPAALQLASLSMRGRDEEQPLFVGPNRMDIGMAEYLKEDVFDRQDPDMREFLLQTCVLEQLTGGICNALTGREDGALMLERLNSDGFLLHLVDDSEGRTWYRFHKLFADFLQQQAHARSPSGYAEAHRAAAGWFERHGMIAAAAAHARMGGETEAALVLLDSIAMEHVWRGRLRTVLNWSVDLTIEHAARYERLFVAYLWAEGLIGDAARALRRLNELAAQARGGRDISGFLTNSLICLPAVFGTARHDFQCMDNTELMSLSGARTFEHGAMANCVIGYGIALGRMDIACRALPVAKAACHVADWTYNAAYTYLAEGHLHLSSLRLDLAGAEVQRGYDWLTANHSEFSQSSAIAASCLAEIRYEEGEQEAAQKLIDRHLPMMAEAVPECILSGYSVAIRMAADRRDFERADELVRDMETHGNHRNAPVVVRSARAMQAWLNALQGRQSLAISQMREAAAIERTLNAVTSSAESVIRHLFTIRTALTLGLADDVLQQMDQLIDGARGRSALRRALYLQVLKARALSVKGDKRAALATMKPAYDEAIRHRFYGCLLNEGELVFRLVRELRSLDQSQNGKNELRIFDGLMSNEKAAHAAPQFKIDAKRRSGALPDITKREADILNAVERGLTNAEIADCFSLSTTTVKWHIRNIFSKLGVGNRTEAAFILRTCPSDLPS